MCVKHLEQAGSHSLHCTWPKVPLAQGEVAQVPCQERCSSLEELQSHATNDALPFDLKTHNCHLPINVSSRHTKSHQSKTHHDPNEGLTANTSSQTSRSMPGERTSSTELELEEGQDPLKDSDGRSDRQFRKPLMETTTSKLLLAK